MRFLASSSIIHSINRILATVISSLNILRVFAPAPGVLFLKVRSQLLSLNSDLLASAIQADGEGRDKTRMENCEWPSPPDDEMVFYEARTFFSDSLLGVFSLRLVGWDWWQEGGVSVDSDHHWRVQALGDLWGIEDDTDNCQKFLVLETHAAGVWLVILVRIEHREP